MQKTKLGRIIERIVLGLALAIVIGSTAGGIYSSASSDFATISQDAR